MGNHIHLIAIPPTDSSLATWAAHRSTNARWLNLRRGETGHVWQNRYYSCPMDDHHQWEALRCVELNPVRARPGVRSSRVAMVQSSSPCHGDGSPEHSRYDRMGSAMDAGHVVRRPVEQHRRRTDAGADSRSDPHRASRRGRRVRPTVGGTGVTAGGQATDKFGHKLGPSGEKQVNNTKSNTREGARNKARNEGSGVTEHRNPKDGQPPHFHPTDAQGKKVPSSTHHSYPDE
jgi:hypothetical protein